MLSKRLFNGRNVSPLGGAAGKLLSHWIMGSHFPPVVSLQWRIEKEGTSLVPNPLLESFGKARLLQRAA